MVSVMLNGQRRHENHIAKQLIIENFDILSIVCVTFFGFLGFGLYLALKSLEKETD